MIALLAVGHVVFVTARAAYLDAGARDGLQAGAVVQLKRAGACKVESVSDHRASCSVQGAQVGDSFAVAAPPPAPPAPPRPQPLPADQVKREAALLSAAALPAVEFEGRVEAARPRLTASLVHAVWASSSDKPWSQERLDVWTRGVPLAGGLSLSADLSARWYSMRAGPVSGPQDRAQLYVWELALRRNLPGAAFAVGRLRPTYAPGATPLDGAQVGFRAQGGNEVGVFGGAMPDIMTTAPSTSAGTAGAYWRVQHSGEDIYLRNEARVAAVSTAELGKRVEAESVGQLALGRIFDLAAELRGAAGDHAGLDAARIDVWLRPSQRLTLNASYRYFGLELPERDGPGVVNLGGASRRGEGAASWEVVDGFVIAARGGGEQDLTTAFSRAFGGPEVSLPRLFGDKGGMSAGYQEERGFDNGRTAWLQAVITAPSWLRLTATGTWSFTRDGLYQGDELGLSVGATARLSELVQLRVMALSRFGGEQGPLQSPYAGGAAGTAQLDGRF